MSFSGKAYRIVVDLVYEHSPGLHINYAETVLPEAELTRPLLVAVRHS